MKATLKKYLSALILLSYCLIGNAQGTSAITASDLIFRETVFLQTDRRLFLAGEEVMVNMLLLEKDTYRPSLLSRYVRLELMDQDGKRLIRQYLELSASEATSVLTLPSDLKSGWYFLRAYTNWMRNFPDSEYTIVPVKVVNPEGQTEESGITSPPGPVNPVDSMPLPGISVRDNSVTIEFNKINQSQTGPLRLLIHRSCTWYWFAKQLPVNGTVTFIVPLDKLPPGLLQFSILADNNKVIASRLWPENPPANRQVSLTANKDQFKLRSNYEVKFGLPDGLSTDSTTTLFTSVSLAEPADPTAGHIPGLPGWSAGSMVPLLPDEFSRWLVENRYPESVVRSFFRQGSGDPVPTADTGLSEQNNPGIRYLPETRSPVLSGTVINKNTRAGVPSVGIAVTMLTNNDFRAVKTGSDGSFYFSIPDIASRKDYILTFISEPDTAWAIIVNTQYDQSDFKPPMSAFSLTTEERNYIGTLSLCHQLEGIFSPPASKTGSRNDSVMVKPFYYPPEWTIHTDNYIELASVQEMVYEVVPDVQVHRKGSQSYITVYSNKPYSRDYETLILLDGIPITGHKELLELRPDRIRAIDVKNRVYIHGGYIFSSIVNFISRNGDFAGLKLPAQSVMGSIEQPSGSSHAGKVASRIVSPEIPGMTPVLLFDAAPLKTKRSFSFSVNDLYGDYLIRISGFDRNGNWFTGRNIVKVKSPNL